MEGVTVLPLANYRDPDRLESPGQIKISGLREPSFFLLSVTLLGSLPAGPRMSSLVILPEPQPFGLGHQCILIPGGAGPSSAMAGK